MLTQRMMSDNEEKISAEEKPIQHKPNINLLWHRK